MSRGDGVRRLPATGGLALLLVLASAALASAAGGYDTSWGAFVGGGTSASANAVVVGAAGAAGIGVSSAPSVIVEAGPLALPFEVTVGPPGGGAEMSPRVFLPLLSGK
jgi:hypothetical protein